MDWRFIKRRFWIGLIFVSLLVFVLIKLSGRQPVAQIAAVEPKRANLSASISSNGKVEPITPYAIRARLQTFVEKVYATEGQQVKKGQLLLTMNVTDARAQLASARVQLLNAQDAVRAASTGGRPDDAARVAKEEFDRRVKLNVQEAALKADQAQHEVASLEEKVASAELRAPVNGTLYSLPAKAGAFVSVGELLAEMADLHKVRVRAFIDEPELGALEPNQSVL